MSRKSAEKSSRFMAILKGLGAESVPEAPEPMPEPTYGTPPLQGPPPEATQALGRLAKRKPRQPDAGTGLIPAGVGADAVPVGSLKPLQPQ